MSVSGLPCQDFAMLVTLMAPGVDRDRVLELLRSAIIMITNNHANQDGYLRWALDVGRTLRGQVARSDLDQLLFTPAVFRHVDPALMGTPQGLQLLEAEISERQVLLRAAFETLQEQIGSSTSMTKWTSRLRCVMTPPCRPCRGRPGVLVAGFGPWRPSR
jgi:hypothetical protein